MRLRVLAPFLTSSWMLSFAIDSIWHQDVPQGPLLAVQASIMGHSMGGHGALTLGLRNPGLYRSISAFSPIAHPSVVPWGEKALGGYLGGDRAAWKQYDATELVRRRMQEMFVKRVS